MPRYTKLYKHYYLLTLRGLLIIAWAIFALYIPQQGKAIKLIFIKYFEFFTIASGLLLILISVLNRKDLNWHWTLLHGILDLAFGALLIEAGDIQVAMVPLVLAIWFLYSGAIHIVESFSLVGKEVPNWWFEFITGSLSLLMAFVLIALKASQREVLYYFVGAFGLIQGIFVALMSHILRTKSTET